MSCKNKNNNNNNSKNKNNNNSTNEKAVYNEKLQMQLQEIRKEKHTNFQILKRMKSKQTKLIYHKEVNQANVSILPKFIVKSQM